jgi:hypothetical protein
VTTPPAAVTSWLRTQAAAFRLHQLSNPFSKPGPDGRQPTPEEDCMRWLVRALADGSCPGAAAAIEWVGKTRAGMREAA